MKKEQVNPELTEDQLQSLGFMPALSNRYLYKSIHSSKRAPFMMCLFPVEDYKPEIVYNVSISNMNSLIDHTNQSITQVRTLEQLKQTIDVLSYFEEVPAEPMHS